MKKSSNQKSPLDQLLEALQGLLGNQQLVSPMVSDLTDPGSMYGAQRDQIWNNTPYTPPAEINKTVQYPDWMANAPSTPSAQPSPSETPHPNFIQNVESGVKYIAGMAWDDFVKMATAAAQEAGVPPSVLVSQAAVESGHGTSPMARNKNNYFGYQAYDSNPDAAKTYSTPQHSVQEVLHWYQSHPNVWAARNDPVKMAQEIKNSGYATDPKYVWTVTHTPEFKALQNIKPTQPVQKPAPKITPVKTPNFALAPGIKSPIPQTQPKQQAPFWGLFGGK